MANVYIHVDGSTIYYTNEAKEGYELRPEYSQDSRGKFIVVELYNNKFILPENSAYLFYRATNTSFNDMNKWDTSEVTNMDHMFSDCWYLQSLDFSNFDTSKVTSMIGMFRGDTSLVTIYASTDFVVQQVQNSDGMFENCTQLVGGAGTTYNSSKIDKTYAKIDGGTADPGYFTFRASPHGWFRCTPYIKENDVWVPVEVYM